MNTEILDFIRNTILSNEVPQQIRSKGLDLYLKYNAQVMIRVGHNTINISKEVFDNVQSLLLQYPNERFSHGKIQAIKELRRLTGLGLRDAKFAVEDDRNFQQPPTT